MSRGRTYTLATLAWGQYRIERHLTGRPRIESLTVAIRNARTILDNFERDRGVLIKPPAK